MRNSLKIAVTSLALLFAAGTASASTVTLGFDGATQGSGDQSFVEDGYTIEATGGTYFGASDGPNGPNEFERIRENNGILTISRAVEFLFVSLDWQTEYSGSSEVAVQAFYRGVSVGVDSFLSSSMNYQTFAASSLAGLKVDKLVIWAERSFLGGGSLDSVTVADVAPVPLPAAGWMLLAGMGGLAATRRRKK